MDAGDLETGLHPAGGKTEARDGARNRGNPAPAAPFRRLRDRRLQFVNSAFKLRWRSWPAHFAIAFAEEEAFGHLFLLYPVFMMAGVVLWLSLPSDGYGLQLASWTALLGILCWITRYGAPSFRYPLRYLLFVALGAVCAEAQVWRTGTVIIDSPLTTTVTGRITEVEMKGPQQWRYTITILNTERPRLRRPPTAALLGVRGQGEVLRPGDIVRGIARLQPPAGPALPGLNDFAFDSYFRGIGAIGGFLGKPVRIARAEDQQPALLTAAEDALATVRSAINRRILTVLPGDTGAFATALVTNDSAAFSKETMEALRISGLAHVISISGLHMVLAASLFFIGLRSLFSLFPGFIQRRPAKKYAAFGAIVTSGLYLLISGLPVPAVRSFIMLAMALGAVMAERSVLTLRSIGIAVFAVILMTPSSILGPSFQMSFAAAAALVSGYSLWRLRPAEFRRFSGFPLYARVLPVIKAVGGVMLTSEIAGFATAIFAVAHFQRITLLGMLGNVAAMPFISFLVMPAGFVAVVLMPFGLDYYPLLLMGKGLDATIAVAYWVASFGGDITTGQVAGWVLPVTSIGFLATILPRTRTLRLAGASLFAAALAVVVLFGSVRRPDMVISETGELVGLYGDGILAANAAKPAAFIFDQWTRALAASEIRPPIALQSAALERPNRRAPLTDHDEWATEDAMEAAAKSARPGRFSCSARDWCLGRLANGMIVITFRDYAFQGPACRQADIAVASLRFRNPECGPGEAVLIERTTLRRRGALAIYLKHGAREDLTDPRGRFADLTVVGAMDGANRAWNRHRFYDWRSGDYGEAFSPER